jgi:carbon monoxide dehydrogenase subunit G
VSGPLEGEATISGSPEAIWSIIHDPSALGRVFPGCESIEGVGPNRLRATVLVRAGSMAVRADVAIAIDDLDPPRRLRLSIDGRPRGLPGSFHASIPIDLLAQDSRTRVRYSIDVRVGGLLAALGDAAIREALRDQVADLVRNIDREIGPEIGPEIRREIGRG